MRLIAVCLLLARTEFTLFMRSYYPRFPSDSEISSAAEHDFSGLSMTEKSKIQLFDTLTMSTPGHSHDRDANCPLHTYLHQAYALSPFRINSIKVGTLKKDSLPPLPTGYCSVAARIRLKSFSRTEIYNSKEQNALVQ